MVSNQTLMKIATLGGFVIGVTGYAFHFRIQYDIKETEAYKDVVSTVLAHKKVVPYLGEPVTMGRITYGNGSHKFENGTVTQNYKWFQFPLTGANTKAKLYYEVTLNRELNNTPEASRIEITFDNMPGKTFVIRHYELERNGEFAPGEK
ncbi:PREDICTED: uncharacterized protein LOC105564285 [Vollenhovia emeryi]|uniref:uncharacterized protein LOC105564285 n=1 Tax=Vollenhovia emeryi TaxID=411798 RepID=UPI0005F42D65|nr:PREDICTED: uncharacterized protein LOC105564285 [Vollenhovia emeryi]XP_011871941.1 PREDICTED: uncharacterized protein LOC105564285 [Vollenhovia emeryi]